MTPYEEWELNSEAASRFYRAIIAIEDAIKYVKLSRFRYIQWKLNRYFKEMPPICHNSTVYES